MATTRRIVAAALGAVVALASAAGAARGQLRADELLLVVNGNSPDSVALAEFYAKARGVPDGRIVRLDLPGSDEIPRELYDRKVVPVVRRHLRENGLEEKVRCLVTFYGMPLRVGGVLITPEQQAEAQRLRTELAASEKRAAVLAASFEGWVRQKTPSFTPPVSGGSLQEMILRTDAAIRALGPAFARAATDTDKREILDRIREQTDVMLGRFGVAERFGPAEMNDPNTSHERRDYWTREQADLAKLRSLFDAAQESAYEPAERERMRDLARDHAGALGYLAVLVNHLGMLADPQSGASLDSELALLWSDVYTRANWLDSPLYHAALPRVRAGKVPQTRGWGVPGLSASSGVLMTARLDAPDDGMVRLMVLAGLKAERDGLKGRMVIDSRGLRPNATQPALNGYVAYDQTLRGLNRIVSRQKALPVLFDENEAVLPAGSVQGQTALYVGWYSVGNYVPAMRFAPGAVAFHVASWELTTLRDPKNNGWVKGLLNDGASASVGPVAEPYLHAFPPADEFFPLLMTGKLTLAEVFWRTSKTVSWQMSLVGDPLYRPFGNHPALAPSDLTPALRQLLTFEEQSARAATRPGNATAGTVALPASRPSATRPAANP